MSATNNNSPGAPAPVIEGVVSRERINRLRSSLPGKESVIYELIDLYLRDLPRRLGAIADAIARADADALVLEAHALRGGAANFGAHRLDEICGNLEEIGRRGALAEAVNLFEQARSESDRVRDVLIALKAERDSSS